VKPLHELPEDVQRCIQGFNIKTDKKGNRTTRVRFCPKLDALDSIARYLKMWTDHVEIIVNDPRAILEAAHERARQVHIERRRAELKLVQSPPPTPETPPPETTPPEPAG